MKVQVGENRNSILLQPYALHTWKLELIVWNVLINRVVNNKTSRNLSCKDIYLHRAGIIKHISNFSIEGKNEYLRSVHLV